MHRHEFAGDTWSKHTAGARLHSFGYDKETGKDYREHFAIQDPYVQGIRDRGPGTGAGTSDDILIIPEKLKKTEFYNGYGQKNGIFFVSWMVIEHSEHFASGLAMIRPETATQFAEEQVDLLRCLSPHFEQAFAHERLIRAETAGYAEMLKSVDKAGVALIGLDENGRVKNLSTAAKALLDKKDPIQLRNNRLQAIERKSNDELQTIISEAHSPWKDVLKNKSNTLRLPRKNARTSLEIKIFPFSPAFDCIAADCELFTDDKPRVVVYLFERRNPIEQARFSFTPKEMQIAGLLKQGVTQGQIAEGIKTTSGALRQQLRGMYRKAGLKGPGSQMKLVRLLLAGN
jgi:DNA-binding CsgD family transcriptional regulator